MCYQYATENPGMLGYQTGDAANDAANAVDISTLRPVVERLDTVNLVTGGAIPTQVAVLPTGLIGDTGALISATNG